MLKSDVCWLSVRFHFLGTHTALHCLFWVNKQSKMQVVRGIHVKTLHLSLCADGLMIRKSRWLPRNWKNKRDLNQTGTSYGCICPCFAHMKVMILVVCTATGRKDASTVRHGFIWLQCLVGHELFWTFQTNYSHREREPKAKCLIGIEQWNGLWVSTLRRRWNWKHHLSMFWW